MRPSLVLRSLLVALTIGSVNLRAETPLPAALRDQATQATERGLTFLEKAAQPGGYWSSADHTGLTGLVIQAFVSEPSGKHRETPPVQRGLDFLRHSVKPDGGLYNKGLGVYNTSICLTTLLRANAREDAPLIEGARRYLTGAQVKNSAKPADDGGFGYNAGGSGRVGRPDLDNTVFALEALARYRDAHRTVERPAETDLDWKAAIDFITRCQSTAGPSDQGGFAYTPIAADDKSAHSYGTMTYAGLLSLIYAEVGKDDARVKAAIEWIQRHYSVDENPGKGAEGLYYYYFVMAKGLNAGGVDTLTKADGTKVNWREALTAKLLSLQKPDGSWANTNERWMEKDPVLVTSYVVLTLNILRGTP